MLETKSTAELRFTNAHAAAVGWIRTNDADDAPPIRERRGSHEG